MAENSKISWTHDTQNWWVGCTKCGPECQHCYIIRELRKQRRQWNEVYLTKTWNDPHKWQRELDGSSKYKRVFTNSLSDFFDRRADKRLAPEEQMYLRGSLPSLTWRSAAWSVIRNTPNLVYLILTKRPHRIMECLPADWGPGYPNVWLGTSVGCNQTLRRIDHLRRVPVHPEAVRFLSCEPLLEDITPNINLDGIGWVICGGESGDGEEYLWTPEMKWTPKDFPGRRTMKLDWAWALRAKAKEQGLPFWFKQITASRAGQGEEVFGRVIHEVPNPPEGEWCSPSESKPNPLLVLQEKQLICTGGQSRVPSRSGNAGSRLGRPRRFFSREDATQVNNPMGIVTETVPMDALWFPKKRPGFAYPGAKYNLAPKLCALMPRDCNRIVDLFAGRGNVTWAAMCDRTLHFEEFWFNDPFTFPFFAALLAAEKFAVPPRSREVFNEMRWREKHGFSALQQPWALSPETWIYNVSEKQREKLGWDEIIVRGTPADGAVANAASMGFAGVPVRIPDPVDIIRLLSEAYLLESYFSFSGGGYAKASMRGAEGRGGPSREGYAQSLLTAQKLLQSRNAKTTPLDYHAVLDALRPGDFLFCDPPYVGANVRTYGWTLQQNIEFRDILLNDKIKGKWMLTEYPHEIYEPLTKKFGKPKEYRVHKSQSISHYTGGKRLPVIECVWRNY